MGARRRRQQLASNGGGCDDPILDGGGRSDAVEGGSGSSHAGSTLVGLVAVRGGVGCHGGARLRRPSMAVRRFDGGVRGGGRCGLCARLVVLLRQLSSVGPAMAGSDSRSEVAEGARQLAAALGGGVGAGWRLLLAVLVLAGV